MATHQWYRIFLPAHVLMSVLQGLFHNSSATTLETGGVYESNLLGKVERITGFGIRYCLGSRTVTTCESLNQLGLQFSHLLVVVVSVPFGSRSISLWPFWMSVSLSLKWKSQSRCPLNLWSGPTLDLMLFFYLLLDAHQCWPWLHRAQALGSKKIESDGH